MTSVLSQSSEELSDSETPSAIGLCIQDDKEFIRNARARTMAKDGERMIKGGERVAFLWYALCHLPESLRKCVFLELLQGSDDGEDVWLWNEGDEAFIKWKWYWLDQPPPWQSAAAALERRLARTPAQTPRRRELQSGAFEMRAAMIVWLALTSAAYKRADEERGVRDREKWDMREWIGVWWRGLPWRVGQWLAQRRNSYDHRAFTAVMDQDKHSCHQEKEESVTCWRSQLFPTQQDSIIYLGDKHCGPCLAHKTIRGSDSPPSWTPSYALVALRCIWDCPQEDGSDVNASRDFSEWLSDQPIYGMKEVNDLFKSLPQDTDEDKYLSWVNKYPSDLRYTITKYSLEEWEAMDDCLIGSERGGSLNIRSWCAAMHWKMMSDLSYSTRVAQFIEVRYASVLESLDFLPPPTPAPEFRNAIRVSGHTCWKTPQMDDYAAAMAFLEEDPKVVGIDVRKYSGCHVCRLPWHLRSLGENLPVEEWEFEADLTEVLVMLQIECSKRKVAWSEISTSAQKKFINTGFSDFTEEAEISDAGSDEDEACGEDERAPVAVIHPSQVNTAGHGENNPSSGLIYDNEAVDVDEESADMTGPLIFTNPSSENPHPYSIGPGNFDEAIIHGQIQDSQPINTLPTIPGGSHGGSDHSFEYIPDVPLHPPAVVPPQHIQNGTPVLWLQDHPKSGSADLIVGWQQGYIRDGASASNFVERASVGQNGGLGDYATTEAFEATYANGNPIRRQAPVQHNSNGSQQGNYSITPMANPITNGIPGQDSGAQYPALHDIQLPSYTNSTRSGNVNYNADGQAWVPYDQPILQELEASQTEVPGRRLTLLSIPDLVNPPVENDVYSQPRDSRASMNQDNLAAVSVQQEIISDKADLSKDDMIKEIKKFLTESFERLGVQLHGTKRNKKLPWLQFDDTLEDEGIEMVNWPKDVLTPGRGSNSSKGLAGVPVRDLKKIYKAIHTDTVKLELRHIPGARKPGQAVSQQEFFAESSASGSRKRPRDAETDGDSRPKKQLVFKNIRYDGVMEAWKA
ncbi:hypothetical protein C8J56DRAFT_1165456 [Mycena floridula]|nr:hypothetical protein C8J56DRAFT_1165456 [Mycena floridula]